MEGPLLRNGLKRAITASQGQCRRQPCLQSRRWMATPTERGSRDAVRPAAPIRFEKDQDQFARRRPNEGFNNRGPRGSSNNEAAERFLMRRIRIVPASPSYFTATPQYTDDLLSLSALLRKFQLLPLCAPGEAPRVAWKTYDQYKSEINEPVKVARYNRLLELVKRLNYIHPSLMPDEVILALQRFKRTLQPFLNKPKPIIIDEMGRARAVGRRKSSHAVVFVVEGEGECMINGRSLTEYFGRMHDRESAVWALKATERLDKYNVWAIARGGGTTGQAEAIMLGLGKALMAHEPDLKPALRRAGVLTRDPRKVERKKAGKLKARKMPAWVKR